MFICVLCFCLIGRHALTDRYNIIIFIYNCLQIIKTTKLDGKTIKLEIVSLPLLLMDCAYVTIVTIIMGVISF